jgi:hypothetical protein
MKNDSNGDLSDFDEAPDGSKLFHIIYISLI